MSSARSQAGGDAKRRDEVLRTFHQPVSTTGNPPPAAEV
jgi:hypothetical protein